ncbi:HNH endonuclease [Pseudomonas sp. N40(2020)]|uniref:HNH endonuclease n=1 Tax=Pseudomonas sp. N40(2020) TaxID=2767798 RepID=UPI0016575000|nr:HNH endonuclease [Pseudomonas sp. N40(2020)]
MPLPLSCIFCHSSESSSVAHIVPESLGGKNAPIGRPGVTCDRCNQYFGQKVESKALHSFPFNGYRLLQGVPSKKGRFVRMDTMFGKVEASGAPGIIQLEPRNDELKNLVKTGRVSQFHLIAEVSEPLAVVRMLLKIGLEQLGKHFYDVAVSSRVEEARAFARRPGRGDNWWFVLCTNPSEVFDTKIQDEVSIEIREQEGILVSIMHLPGVTTIVPLEKRAIPPTSASLLEPRYRIIRTTC